MGEGAIDVVEPHAPGCDGGWVALAVLGTGGTRLGCTRMPRCQAEVHVSEDAVVGIVRRVDREEWTVGEDTVSFEVHGVTYDQLRTRAHRVAGELLEGRPYTLRLDVRRRTWDAQGAVIMWSAEVELTVDGEAETS